jgi:high-affinity Fe2+/Pb2+ permease
MLKKILLIIALMLVLVALNWFEELIAQDFDTLPQGQKGNLFEENQSQISSTNGIEIFEHTGERVSGLDSEQLME